MFELLRGRTKIAIADELGLSDSRSLGSPLQQRTWRGASRHGRGGWSILSGILSDLDRLEAAISLPLIQRSPSRGYHIRKVDLSGIARVPWISFALQIPHHSSHKYYQARFLVLAAASEAAQGSLPDGESMIAMDGWHSEFTIPASTTASSSVSTGHRVGILRGLTNVPLVRFGVLDITDVCRAYSVESICRMRHENPNDTRGLHETKKVEARASRPPGHT
ncbi:hypothetical protein CLAIMM_10425 isoform 2 [Cladophialophora immunda]|nr:hypothetical protein CLAIMM_10425 isoform 2 [Cladophialophora immunda]